MNYFDIVNGDGIDTAPGTGGKPAAPAPPPPPPLTQSQVVRNTINQANATLAQYKARQAQNALVNQQNANLLARQARYAALSQALQASLKPLPPAQTSFTCAQ